MEIAIPIHTSSWLVWKRRLLTPMPYDPEPRGWVSYLDVIVIATVIAIVVAILLIRWLF